MTYSALICTTWAKFHYHLIWLKFNPKYFMHISDKSIRNVKSRKYSLPMNLHKNGLFLVTTTMGII